VQLQPSSKGSIEQPSLMEPNWHCQLMDLLVEMQTMIVKKTMISSLLRPMRVMPIPDEPHL
jgi:hypothetical protein